MKKVVILSLVCFALAGLGKTLREGLASLLPPSPAPASSWAMFKELFQ